jgi:hypothetical protein
LACVFHIVSSFVFLIIIIIIIIIIAFVCNKETVITGTLHHRNRPKPPTTTESHLTNPPATPNQADLANRKKKKKKKKKKPKKNWVVRDRESTQTRDPPQAHATPPHRDPCKPTKNPQQTHCKQPPWRSRRERESVLTSPRASPPHSLTFVVAAQLASPRLRRHRLAAPHSATPHVPLRRLNKTKNKKLLLY